VLIVYMGCVALPAGYWQCKALIVCGVLLAGKVVDGWFPLLTRRKTRKGEVRLRLQLTAVERLPMYCQGLGPGGCHGAVHQAYFPLRRGCRITLYQNASVTTDEEVRSSGDLCY